MPSICAGQADPGGAHPRFARNTGSGDPLATATRLVPVDIEIGHGASQPSLLSLPTAAADRASPSALPAARR
jgi:hypothetical protein